MACRLVATKNIFATVVGMDANDDEKGFIEVDELETLSNMLAMLSHSYRQLATQLRAEKIERFPGRGLTTARRGAEYLANFTSTVMKAYQQHLANGGTELPTEVEGQLLRGEAVARKLAKKGGIKKLGTNNGTRKS